MKIKKIVIYSILCIILPLIGVAVVSVFEKNTKINFAYIVGPVLFLSIDIFLYYLFFNIKNIYKYIPLSFIILIDISILIYSIIMFNHPYYMLIGLIGVNGFMWLVKYNYMFLFTTIASIYPFVFYAYDVNYMTLIIYLAYIAICLIATLYKKYHKTKIYLYDNYD